MTTSSTAKTPTAVKKTTARKTTAARAATKKAAETAAKPALDKAPVAKPSTALTPVVVQNEPPVVSAPEMKKRDLINLVVERSGVKKRDAKPAVEAALAVLGDALAEGRDLNLPPLGKIKVTKQKEIPQGSVLTVRLRRNSESKPSEAPDPLAQAAE